VQIANILLSSQNGGVEQSFVNYCKIMQRLGHDVLAIVGFEAPYIKDLENLGVKIVEAPNHFGYYDIFTINKIKNSLKEFKADLAFSHTGKAIILTRKAIKKLSHKIPQIAVNHSGNVKRSIEADFILSVNKDIHQKTIKFGQDENKSLVMPNFIDIEEKEITQDLENKLIIGRNGSIDSNKDPKKDIIIGAIARLSKEKGLDFLIEAIKILHKNNYPVKLKIAGSGDEKLSLEYLRNSLDLQDSIEFLGWIDDREEFFNEIDIFCLPSKEETFGLVILEAMLYKKPIISTKTAGAIMILQDEVSGILINNSKPDLIALAIMDLIDNPKKIPDLIYHAHKELIDLYSSQAAQKNFKNLLSKF
jgi:glycosyltransferase involved in cell wall biosynthesis